MSKKPARPKKPTGQDIPAAAITASAELEALMVRVKTLESRSEIHTRELISLGAAIYKPRPWWRFW